MKYALNFLLCIILFFFVNKAGYAQLEPVAWIDDMYDLNDKTRSITGVFNEYKAGFINATLYVQDTSDYKVEMSHKKNNTLYTTTVKITEEQLEHIRDKLYIELKPFYRFDDNAATLNGRNLLIASNIGNGLLHGGLLALGTRQYSVERTIFPPGGMSIKLTDRIRPWNAAFTVLIPGIYGTSTYFLTRDKHIGMAATNMYLSGSLLGYINGYMVSAVAKNNDLFAQFDANRLEYSLLLGTSLAQGWLSYHIAKKNKFTYSQSVAVNTGSLWGMIGGYCISNAFTDIFQYADMTFLGTYTIGSSIAGGMIMNRVYQNNPRTTGDYRFISSASLIGMGLGLNLISPFSQNSFASNLAIGLGAFTGFILSHAATKHTKFSPQQGLFNILVTPIGGALGGMGIAFMTGGFKNHVLKFITGGMLAAWLTDYFITKKSNQKTRRFNKGNGFFGSSIDVKINPGGFVFLNASRVQQTRLMTWNAYPNLVSISIGLN